MWILAGLLGAAAGAAEAVLNAALFAALFQKRTARCLGAGAGKLAVYAAFLLPLFLVLRENAAAAAAGFAAGFFPTILICCVRRLKNEP